MPALSRRHFVTLAGSAALVGGTALPRPARAATPFVQPPLPFAEDALAPTISARTVQFHYGKHHAGYFAQVNQLVAGSPYAEMSLTDVVLQSAGRGDEKIFNNAAQAFNHNFYWDTLKPGSDRQPKGALAEAIERDFGDLASFQDAYLAHAVGLFGSGWVWLVAVDGKLALEDGANAGTPLTEGRKLLAVIDVWEHAYYLDDQNRRADHVRAVIENLINWDVIGERLEA